MQQKITDESALNVQIQSAVTDLHKAGMLLSDIVDRLKSGTWKSFVPALPAMFTLHSEPLTLRDHFPFENLYSLSQPLRTVVVAARQTSKTTNIGFQGVTMATTIPHFNTIMVTPLFEQARRLSSLYVAPAIAESPLRGLWIDTSVMKSVLSRTFKNGSRLLFSFAYTDARRVRGLSGDRFVADETQDLLPGLLPVIREVISHSRHGALEAYFGTPLTSDNLLTTLYNETSQAEWFVPCSHCTTDGHTTWNIPSIEHHIEKMIGPWHDNISEEYPATICHKCRQPISPRHGRWVHRYPERQMVATGYHLPQILLPHHYANPREWGSLLAKQQGLGPTPVNMFYNEVLAEPYDRSSTLVSDTELRAVANLWPNDDEEAIKRCKENDYIMLVLAADWGGGGTDEISLTTVTLVGLKFDGRIDVIWGKRLLTPHDHIGEAVAICKYWNMFRPHVFSHDYNGSGALRETIIIQAGLPPHRIMPCYYVASASAAPCYHVDATPQHPRNRYHVDKSRLLQLVCTMIKLQRIRFFEYDYVSPENPGLIRDFLALTEHKTKTTAVGDIYRIDKKPGKIDDFAQSIVYGCTALWYINDAWPNLVDPKYVMTPDQELAAFGDTPDANVKLDLTR